MTRATPERQARQPPALRPAGHDPWPIRWRGFNFPSRTPMMRG